MTLPASFSRPRLRPLVRLSARVLLLCGGAALWPLPAAVAQEAEDTATDTDITEIIVIADRLPGSVKTNIKAISAIDADDIASYGASSIDELVTALGPQAGSGRGRGGGRPVMLLNGRRISGFREVRDLPPDAVARIEIFPEELALRFGYRPDQRVMNIILKPDFSARTAEAEWSAPSDGGRQTGQLEGNFTRIGKGSRFNVDVELERSGLLTEAERGIVRPQPGLPYALGGNVTAPVNGAEIDPGLTALAGSVLSVAPVPAAGGGTLGAFAAGAGTINSTAETGFRSLSPREERLETNASWSRELGPGSEISLNAQYEVIDRESLLGLASASLSVPQGSPFSPFSRDVVLHRYFGFPTPLRRAETIRTAGGSAGLNGNWGDWRWTLNGNVEQALTDRRTFRRVDIADLQQAISAGTINPFGADIGADLRFAEADQSRSLRQNAIADALIVGSPAELPAGPVSLSLGIGYDGQWIDSRAQSEGRTSFAKLSRRTFSTSGSIDLPLTRDGSAIGAISLSGNAGYENLTDFGGLASYGTTLRWSPVQELDVSLSWITEQEAPLMAELGDPVVRTPGIAVFDFATGQTVAITRTTGGNPALPAEQRRDLKLAANWSPRAIEGLGVQLEYFRNRSDNVTADFPLLTPQIEAAFPDRVTRDASGTITAIDARPVSYARTASDNLRVGFDWRGSLKRKQSEGDGQGTRRGGSAPSPLAMLGRGRGGSGRWNLSFAYSRRLKEEILIRNGLSALDLLGGDATGTNGGASRHRIEAEAGLMKGGIGVRMSADYSSGSHVVGEPGTNGQTLRFSGLTRINLYTFIRPDQQPWLIRHAPFLKNARIRLKIDNLLNARQKVRDQNGLVPLSYQARLLDPLGRVVSVSLRKQF